MSRRSFVRSGKKPPLSSSDILAARTHGYERQGSLCVACQTCAAFYFRTRGEAVKVRCSPLEGDSWPLGPTNWNRAHEGPVFLSPPNSEKFRGVGCRGPSLDETSMGDEDKLRQVCLGAHSLASRIGYHPASGNRTGRGISGKAFWFELYRLQGEGQALVVTAGLPHADCWTHKTSASPEGMNR